MERKTLLQLIEVFRKVALKHEEIHTFQYGTEDIVNKDTDFKAFAVRIAPEQVTYIKNTVTFSLVLELWAETKQDDSDRLIQESEAEMIMNDLISSAFRGLINQEGWDLPIDQEGQIEGLTATSVVHEKEARLTGWALGFEVQGFNDLNYCLAPFDA